MKSAIITLIILTNVLNIELATNDFQREKGLMNRKSWGKIDGMLFVHEKPAQAAYWMKNTYLDIYMVFMDENFKPLEIYKPETLSTKTIFSSNCNIKYVLEINTKHSNLVFGNFNIISEKLKNILINLSRQ